VKVLRYEIKDLVPPQEILHAMQAQITAEREKRARIATSEGRKIEQINLATGQRAAAIQESEGQMQAAINLSNGERQATINKAQGEAEALRLVADATGDAIRRVAGAVHEPGGIEAVNLKVAQQYVDAFGKLAKTSNTLILPANVSDVGGLVASALQIVKGSQGASKEAAKG
jgi:regulator of protease activity HflC (stomatin/prohibitin superfamily)